MLIRDLRRFSDTRMFDCSVCIVGGGPAGLTLATELANTSLRVIVVESGGDSREDAFAAGLNEIESIGAPRVMNQQLVRNRVLGGSSLTWFGRCISLDAIDFEHRDWVPHSGWPLSPDDLEPYRERSAEYLGLDPALPQAFPEGSILSECLRPEMNSDLRAVMWQFSSRSSIHKDYVRFGLRFKSLHSPNVQVLTHATLTQIETTRDGSHVASLEISTPEGKLHRIRAGQVVLCGGGIENARMLLASNRIDSAGVGNRHGNVGRFFMDHPRTTVGTFSPEAAPLVQRELGLFQAAPGVRAQCGMALSSNVQRREGLLNCAAWTTQHVADDDAWRSLRVVSLGNGDKRLAAAKVILENADQIALGLWQKFVRGQGLTRKLKQLDLDVMVEQVPDSESRIRLSSRKDALGVPLSQIDWKISELECRSVIRLSHAINDALKRAELPGATLVDWVRNGRPEDAVFRDSAHPLGATRMAERAEDGVVDPDGKVFGVDNLYIAGSSIFPTGGHANPTLAIVALALRLADHLRDPAFYPSEQAVWADSVHVAS